jgi:hypothetical protein
VRADQDILPMEQRPLLTPMAVDGDYFAVLGIPLVEGRSFLPHDRPDETIVLSRRMASQWFPEGALGQTVAFTRAERLVVVGVVENVHAASVREESSAPEYYTPIASTGPKAARAIVLRTDRSARAIDSDVRTIVREIDPTATVLVETAADAIGLALAPRRVAQNAVIALALLALAMAVVNVYALSAYSVVQRSREIGIRIALGATTTDALRLVMRRGIIWIACGLAVGTATTFALARPALQAQIANLPTDEPWLLALAFAIVAIAAIVASWLPARRAARIDPAVALRTE